MTSALNAIHQIICSPLSWLQVRFAPLGFVLAFLKSVPLSEFQPFRVAALTGLLFLFADSLAFAQIGPEVVVMEIQFPGEKERQRVVLGLYDAGAPGTVSNFKELVSRKFYDNMRFHRVFPDTLVQTGDPYSRHGDNERSGTGGPGYTIPAELGLPHKEGAIAMARLNDKINPSKASNGSQFYVCLVPMPDLDGEYTVFGEVLEGMDVLRRVSKMRTDSNDFPVDKIIIRQVYLEAYVVPARLQIESAR